MNHLIFDLDGTLVDSAESIRGALIESCKINNIEPIIPISEIKIGPPLNKILRSILPHEESSLYHFLRDTFIEVYDRKFCTECTLYPGAIDALSQAAKNADLFLLTNKRISPTMNILRHHKILPTFQAIIGSDSVSNNGLSKSMSISYLIHEYGLDRLECTYFGDTEGDAIACQEAGIDFVHVSWGYGDTKEMANFNYLTIDNWDRLCNFT